VTVSVARWSYGSGRGRWHPEVEGGGDPQSQTSSNAAKGSRVLARAGLLAVSFVLGCGSADLPTTIGNDASELDVTVSDPGGDGLGSLTATLANPDDDFLQTQQLYSDSSTLALRFDRLVAGRPYTLDIWSPRCYGRQILYLDDPGARQVPFPLNCEPRRPTGNVRVQVKVVESAPEVVVCDGVAKIVAAPSQQRVGSTAVSQIELFLKANVSTARVRWETTRGELSPTGRRSLQATLTCTDVGPATVRTTLLFNSPNSCEQSVEVPVDCLDP
jgi:hypothetical protein